MKVLFLDCETSPLIGYTWGIWETNVIEKIQEFHMLSIAYKWLDGPMQSAALPDYPLYKKDKNSDKELMKEIWEVMNEADVIVAHNGAAFDLKKINTRMIANGLTPPSQYKVVDTLKVARKFFKFDGNRLNDLGKFLGLGEKTETGGFGLWKSCMDGDKEAWKKMVRYNRQDVTLLEKLYLRLRPWIETHPNFRVTESDPITCPACDSKNLIRRGYQLLVGGKERPRAQCKDCGKWCSGKIIKNKTHAPN